MTRLTAGAPLEQPRRAVGRRSIVLLDHSRDRRTLGVDLWYPAEPSDAPKSVYEVLPGVEYAAATAQAEAPALAGRFPLVVLSHGRTGTRISYSMVCEALAARGAVVVSADHPGDALMDWLAGQQADNRTNEINRVADAHFLLAAMLHAVDGVPVDVANAIDHDQIVLIGHSYGAFTAFGAAAGSRGVAPHPKVKAVVAFQGYTAVMSDALLGRVQVPTLLVVSMDDRTTPPEANADRAWALLPGSPTWRLDLDGAGHQAISDIPLYAELADQVPGLPDLVRDYLHSTAEGSAEAAGRGWRALQQLQVAALWAFLQVVLGLDTVSGEATAAELEQTPGLRLRRR